MNIMKHLAHASPGIVVLVSMCAVIICGTALLAMPCARTTPMPIIDLLFTATSATCVTGLFTVPIDHFTTIGHAIIMVLIQIGGLGLITLTLMFFSLFTNLGFTTQIFAGHMLELETWRKMRGLLICIICITLCSELIGMLLVYSQIAVFHSLKHGMFHALFHSISSFCNAGIIIPGKHVAQLGQNYVILITTTLLMFIGGLGFITWHEVVLAFKARWQQTRFRYSLHSKIVIYGSCALLICSSIIFWLLERDHVLAKLPITLTSITTLFQAVSFKSAGFLIASPEAFQSATIFLILVISFIGSSPASTGSGIKITSFALFLATVRTALSNRGSVDIKGRTIPKDQIFKVVAVIAIALGWIGLSTFCLLITEKNWQFFDIVVEAWSAFTNLGITMGLTPSLTFIGKCIIIVSMIFGRVGIFTIALALRMVRKQEATTFRYPEERVMIG